MAPISSSISRQAAVEMHAEAVPTPKEPRHAVQPTSLLVANFGPEHKKQVWGMVEVLLGGLQGWHRGRLVHFQVQSLPHPVCSTALIACSAAPGCTSPCSNQLSALQSLCLNEL